MTKPLLGSILALYVIAAVLIGHFPLLDVIPFKAAGLHWALSGHFAAPEMRGFQDLRPPLEDIYFAHLPGYVFVFGLFVKLFGFGPRQCLLYDALIHAWLGMAQMQLSQTSNDPVPHFRRARDHFTLARALWRSLDAEPESEAMSHQIRRLDDEWRRHMR